MAERTYLSEDLLRPVSAEEPAGRDLRFESIFREILEARRDDTANGRSPQWATVADLSLKALQVSKDIRLCCLLTEAAIHLDGFSGLRDCLRLTRELLTRFWDLGLFPSVENGDLDDRGRPLAFFNERMAESIGQVPITGGRDAAHDSIARYGYLKFQQAMQVGRKAALDRLPGERRATVAGLINQGWITLDTFESAMAATKLDALESIYGFFTEAREQFNLFEQTVDEKFGDTLGGFSASRSILDEIGLLLDGALKKAKAELPAATMLAPQTQAAGAVTEISRLTSSETEQSGLTGAWREAEEMVKTGQIDQGLQRMASLAANETSGRARFLRKLALVDACKLAGRDRLARTILEELNALIIEFKLDQWESTAIVGGVWSRLYRQHKKNNQDADNDEARVLYNKLCRLDPWQTYVDCED